MKKKKSEQNAYGEYLNVVEAPPLQKYLVPLASFFCSYTGADTFLSVLHFRRFFFSQTPIWDDPQIVAVRFDWDLLAIF